MNSAPLFGSASLLGKTFDVTLGGLFLTPTYWQAAAIVFLLFLLVLTLARLRHVYVNWSFKAAGSMILIGFVLAVVLEGFMVLGGRTLFTEVLGWKNPPKPISVLLNASRAKLVKVLGVAEEVPASYASETPNYKRVVSDYQSLSPKEAEKVRLQICQP